MKTVLAQHSRSTEVITAEHHPDDHGGMRYLLFIVGGKHHGIQIHCPTEVSVIRLFDEILAARKVDAEHPYLTAV